MRAQRALADLRRKLEAELLGDKEDENGSAAYRCLACDRPLPPKDQAKHIPATRDASRSSVLFIISVIAD